MKKIFFGSTYEKLKPIEALKDFLSHLPESLPPIPMSKKIAIEHDIENQKTPAELKTIGDQTYKSLRYETHKEDAAYYYWQAAIVGNNDALMKLSNMLFNGDGIEKDLKLSNILMIAALDRGCQFPGRQKPIDLEYFTLNTIRKGLEISNLIKHNEEQHPTVTPALNKKLSQEFSSILSECDFVEQPLTADILGSNAGHEAVATPCCIIL